MRVPCSAAKSSWSCRRLITVFTPACASRWNTCGSRGSGCAPRQSFGVTWLKYGAPAMQPSQGCPHVCVLGVVGRVAQPAIASTTRNRAATSKRIEARGIVDENPFLQRRLGRHLREEVDEVTVVRHVLADVRMRPVGAPEDAIGRRLD